MPRACHAAAAAVRGQDREARARDPRHARARRANFLEKVGVGLKCWAMACGPGRRRRRRRRDGPDGLLFSDGSEIFGWIYREVFVSTAAGIYSPLGGASNTSMASSGSAASTSTSLRLFFPTTTTHHLSKPPKPKQHLLSLSSPISYQRLAATPPPKSAPSPSPNPSTAVDPVHLPPGLRDIVSLFQSVPDPRTRYKQLLAYAAKLPPMDPALKTEANRVRGCVSQVWVHAAPEPPDRVRFQADSDAQLTKGLAALLVLGLSGEPARDVARVPVEFIELLGIRQSLSPSRNSGLLNMLNLMKRKALEIAASEANTSEEIGQNSFEDDAKPAPVEKEREFMAFGVKEESSGGERHEEQELEVAAVMEANGGLGGGRKERIRERLERELSPVELEIEDISHLHKGHAGVAGSNGETHFNVHVVSKEFEGKSLLKRHRVVYDLLQEELKTGLHALSIDAKTPAEV